MAQYQINYTQSNFTGGLVAPELYSRNDFGKVKTGLRKCDNFFIREAGGLEFRPGTEFIVKIPTEWQDKFVLSSIDDMPVFYAESGINYLNSADWVELSYPSEISPDIDKLETTELKRRLYFYDGTMKLCSVIKTNDSTLGARIEKFADFIPNGATISLSAASQPSPYVPTLYHYTFSIAADKEHETIAHAGADITANADLSQQAITITINIPASAVVTDQRIFIYKRYQGKDFFLTSIKMISGTTTYTYKDSDSESVDMSKTILVKPPYVEDDGSILKVNSIADYGQRVFMTLNDDKVQVVYTPVGNTDSLAYSELRNDDEAGYQEIPISHYDGWCKVYAGLQLLFSTSYTISPITGFGDLTLEDISIFDSFSKTVSPVSARSSVIYTNSSNKKIFDFVYTIEKNGYDGVDLTLLIRGLIKNISIKRIAFKDYPVRTLYVLFENKELYGLTYLREQNIYGWWRVKTRPVRDILVINRPGEDDLYLVTENPNGVFLEKAFKRDNPFYLDCVIEKPNPTANGNLITGLSMLANQDVVVYDMANDEHYGDYDIEGKGNVKFLRVDSDGNLQVGDTETMPLTGNVRIGLPYYGEAETIPLEFADSNGNSTIGRKKIINSAIIRFGPSRGLSYKTIKNEFKITCAEYQGDYGYEASLKEGQQNLNNLLSEPKWDSTITILQREPYPASIYSITLGVTFNDKN
ncbi:MAG: hypothetical protein LBF28_03325 [Rickettsiales bacterium]|jgi:hypothetical protein|nr:hypothetical protein [Rickettsiales bacterium]